jgi:hypothetical protein
VVLTGGRNLTLMWSLRAMSASPFGGGPLAEVLSEVLWFGGLCGRRNVVDVELHLLPPWNPSGVSDARKDYRNASEPHDEHEDNHCHGGTPHTAGETSDGTGLPAGITAASSTRVCVTVVTASRVVLLTQRTRSQ